MNLKQHTTMLPCLLQQIKNLTKTINKLMRFGLLISILLFLSSCGKLDENYNKKKNKHDDDHSQKHEVIAKVQKVLLQPKTIEVSFLRSEYNNVSYPKVFTIDASKVRLKYFRLELLTTNDVIEAEGTWNQQTKTLQAYEIEIEGHY